MSDNQAGAEPDTVMIDTTVSNSDNLENFGNNIEAEDSKDEQAGVTTAQRKTILR